MQTKSTGRIIELNATKKVALIKQNDGATLKQLYKTNFAQVKMYVIKNNGSEQEAKDIYQEAFIAMWRNIKEDKFEAESETAVNGYLFQIAKNKWLDHLRSAKYKKTTSLSAEMESREMDPENEEMHLKNIQNVMRSVAQLGEQCQRLLKLFYFEKKSYRAIAEILELDEAYARTAKYRCIEKLRKIAQINPQ